MLVFWGMTKKMGKASEQFSIIPIPFIFIIILSVSVFASEYINTK